MKFTAELLSGGKTATGIEVPAAVLDTLGGGKRPAVVATVNGYTYRTTVGIMAGRFMLPFSAEHRAASGLAAGDTLEVDLTLDTAPRETSVPDDLAAALEQSPRASAAFAALAPGRRKAIVGNVETAKTPETRRRRIEKAVVDLGVA